MFIYENFPPLNGRLVIFSNGKHLSDFLNIIAADEQAKQRAKASSTTLRAYSRFVQQFFKASLIGCVQA